MNYLIEIAAYVCECVTLLLCIHSFLGKKIKLDYKTVLLVIADVTVLMVIQTFRLPGVLTLINQGFVFLYVWSKFKIKPSQNVILLILNVLINTAVQALSLIPAYPILFFLGFENNESIIVLLINLLSMIIITGFVYFIKLNGLYLKIIKWDKKIIKILYWCAIIIFYLIIRYKTKFSVELKVYFISGILVSIVIIMLFYWQKERYENKKKNLELHMQELYGKAFEGMIENIRIRQHDFKNQLAAIYGMHLTSDSLEELVEKQRKYCNYLEDESKYDSILTRCNDKVLAGFLYNKLSECDRNGANVRFNILVNNLDYKLAIYEIIEIIGVLIDNAIEGINDKTTTIYFEMIEDNEKLCITCRNIAKYIPAETLYKFFDKGFSTKGKDRGIGLYNIKKILEGKGEIIVTNRVIEQDNWLEFKVTVDKR